jgi:hypothetical protein
MNVRRLLRVAPLIVAAVPVAALARDCNEVKAEIDAKIKEKGVSNYALQIVNGADVNEGKTVGSCDAGAKRIVYFRSGDPIASSSLVTEKAKENKVAEHSDNPGGDSTAESGFVDGVDTLLNQPDTALSPPCVVGNWTGTPRC